LFLAGLPASKNKAKEGRNEAERRSEKLFNTSEFIHPIVVRFAPCEKGCAQKSDRDGFTEATLPPAKDSDLVRGFPMGMTN